MRSQNQSEAVAVLQQTISDLEERHAAHNEQRDRYVEEMEQAALEAIRERNESDAILAELLGLRETIADAVLPGAFPPEVIEQVLRRAALALAAGDVPRAHRALNDAIASARVQGDAITESTLICETDLFDITIESALEHMGIVTIGDLVDATEEELCRKSKGQVGKSLGSTRLKTVLEVRLRVRARLVKSAEACATRRAV